MLAEDLELLQCPSCEGRLLLAETTGSLDGSEIVEGALHCGCGCSYPVRDGIPEFTDSEQYTHSFGAEWKKWSRVQFDSDNVGTPVEGATRKRFFTVTGIQPSWLAGRTVLEVGCGPGRFLDVSERQGARAVGLELSEAAYVARENLRGRNVLIVRGDALNPPFRREVFDLAFSIGVLHHTPDPSRGFSRMVATVKPGGRVAAHVYDMYDTFGVRRYAIYRRIFGMLGRRATIAYAYLSASVIYHITRIPILGLIVSMFLPVFKWPIFQHRYLNMFDRLTPTYNSYHSTREVFEWFKDAGCTDIEPTAEGPTSFNGTVKES